MRVRQVSAVQQRELAERMLLVVSAAQGEPQFPALGALVELAVQQTPTRLERQLLVVPAALEVWQRLQALVELAA